MGKHPPQVFVDFVAFFFYCWWAYLPTASVLVHLAELHFEQLRKTGLAIACLCDQLMCGGVAGEVLLVEACVAQDIELELLQGLTLDDCDLDPE
jgi:hypothetical protein